MEYARFEALLRARNLTVYRVSKGTGIAASTFSDWKSGRSTPKADKLARIADFFSVSMDTLLGVQPMQGEPTSPAELRRPQLVPVVERVLLGQPIVTAKTAVGMEFADVAEPEDHFYYLAGDDRMRDCGILPGSHILFHKQSHAEQGQIILCLIPSGEAALGRFAKHGRRISLLPENTACSPILISTEDFEAGRARILGVAVEVKTKL